MPLRSFPVALACLGLAGVTAACGSQGPEPISAATEAVVGRPTACQPIAPGSFANGVQLTPVAYGQQPTFRAELGSPIGDAARADAIRIRVDAATTIGPHALGGAATCFENGTQCVVVLEDMDPATQIPAKTFAAVAGTITIDAQRTPDESAGTIRGVELREIAIAETNVPWRAASLVPGGACLWVEEAKFDTRRADGCDPTAKAPCAPGHTCIAENAAGSDGSCVAAGATRRAGDSCTTDEANGSDCPPAHRCVDLGAGQQCVPTCDLLAAQSGCPAATACGPFGLCHPLPASDPAQIGEACATDDGPCGRDGARGVCFELYGPDGQPWDGGSRCWGYERARSACVPGDDLGYASYAQGRDRSLGICTNRL